MAKPTRNFARRIGATKAADGRHQTAKMWSAMRMLRRFTAADIAAVVETTTADCVAYYARKWTTTGFLRVTHSPRRGVAPSYFLCRDSGPVAPSLIKRRTAVFDHNTNTEYPLDDHT